MQEHSDAEVAAMFESLRKADATRRCHVVVCSGALEAGEDGRFNPIRGDYAVILLPERGSSREAWRTYDLITLGHELGHWRSWRSGQRSAEYEAVLGRHRSEWRQLSAADRRLVMDEEIRAWDFAVEMLSSVGFRSWDALASRRRKSLDIYAELLQITADCST